MIGGDAPPAHINATPREPSPPPAGLASALPEPLADAANKVGDTWRQSVAWVSGMAADVLPGSGDKLPATQEEDEDKPVPDIQVSQDDGMGSIDKSVGK